MITFITFVVGFLLGMAFTSHYHDRIETWLESIEDRNSNV